MSPIKRFRDEFTTSICSLFAPVLRALVAPARNGGRQRMPRSEGKCSSETFRNDEGDIIAVIF